MSARVLTPSQAQVVTIDLARGIPASVLAERYGCSARTIYRYAKLGRQEWVRVEAGEYWTEVALTEYGPILVGPWWAR